MTQSRTEIIHRRGVFAAGALVVLTVVTVAATQLTGGGKVYTPQGELTASADLHFTDEADGLVAVYDAVTGTRLIEYGEDEGVFVRVVMRGVARQRRLRGEGAEVPVRLAQMDGVRLWLIDPTNGIEIYLNAFGPDNVAAFAEILEREEQILSADAQAGAQ